MFEYDELALKLIIHDSCSKYRVPWSCIEFMIVCCLSDMYSVTLHDSIVLW